MTPPYIRRQLTQTQRALDQANKHLDDTWRRLEDWDRGMTTGQTKGPTNQVADPTGELATTVGDDPAGKARAELANIVAQLDFAAGQLEWWIAENRRRDHPSTKPLLCWFHKQAGIDHLAEHDPTDVGGRVRTRRNKPVKRPMCRACYDYVRRKGLPPRPEDVHHYDESGRWPLRAVK